MGKMHVGRRTFLALSASVGTVLAGGGSAGALGTRRPVVPHAGEFVRIYDPSVGEDEQWYINDHCFVQAGPDEWHLFGITHPEPANPEEEDQFAHATAPGLHGPWVKQPMALTVDAQYGETHLWAPHVIWHEGTYYMFYAGGGENPTQSAINLASSTDLFHWTRHPDGPLFRDGYEARDPYMVWVNDRWVCYYTANDDPAGGRHIVAYRTSTDLITWGPREVAFTSAREGTGGGDTESPFLVQYGGEYYLFIGPCGAYDDTPEGYSCTRVYRSPDPFHFPVENDVAKLPTHAPEVVHDSTGSAWISHCGWEQGGVYLAPLSWAE